MYKTTLMDAINVIRKTGNFEQLKGWWFIIIRKQNPNTRIYTHGLPKAIEISKIFKIFKFMLFH